MIIIIINLFNNMKGFKKVENNKNKESETEIYLIKNILKKKDKAKRFNLSKIIIYINFIIIYFILYKVYNRKSVFKDKKSELDYDSILKQHMRTSIVWPLPSEIKYKPWMDDENIIAFSYLMKPENIYFEFGSGGSTNIASYYKLKTYSVESNVEWHEKLKNESINANYITIDLKGGALGHPGQGTTVEDWKKYIEAYKSEYNADIILIDGVFRVACAFNIFPKIRKDTIILFHDYSPQHYHQFQIIENYYIKVRQWGNLAAFFKNPFIDHIPEELYNTYVTRFD